MTTQEPTKIAFLDTNALVHLFTFLGSVPHRENRYVFGYQLVNGKNVAGANGFYGSQCVRKGRFRPDTNWIKTCFLISNKRYQTTIFILAM